MSLRSSALKTAARLRGIASKPGIDVYTTSVTIRRRTWLSGRVGKGDVASCIDVDLVLKPRPKVRELTQREIAGSGGDYKIGDVKVGPITPAHPSNPGVGYTAEQLDPTVTTNGVEIIYVLNGGMSGEYKLKNLETDRAFSYTMLLSRKRSTP